MACRHDRVARDREYGGGAVSTRVSELGNDSRLLLAGWRPPVALFFRLGVRPQWFAVLGLQPRERPPGQISSAPARRAWDPGDGALLSAPAPRIAAAGRIQSLAEMCLFRRPLYPRSAGGS